MNDSTLFKPGNNIAMKVPPAEFVETVTFYRDILCFEELSEFSVSDELSVVFKFGDKNLWIDRTPGLSQAEIWLEILTPDVKSAEAFLQGKGIVKRDDIETLPADFEGFWIVNPAGVIHLLGSAGQ